MGVDETGAPPRAPLLVYPEPTWEPSLDRPAVDEAFLDARLGARPDLRARSWTALSGGLRHATLRSDDLVLRIALDPEEDLRREAALLRHVAGSVRVPRVVDVLDGALVLEHVAHEECPATFEAGRAAGRAAARLHRTRFPHSGFLDASLSVPDPFLSALEGLRTWAEGLLSGEAGRVLGRMADAVRDAWDSRRDALAAAGASPALVHGDFKAANVKWLPGERDVSLLDWEFAWAGPPLMDLGQMLRWDDPAPFAAGLEAGYREEGGDLPEDWRETAEALDLFHLVGLLDGAERRPARRRDVLRRVEASRARLGGQRRGIPSR